MWFFDNSNLVFKASFRLNKWDNVLFHKFYNKKLDNKIIYLKKFRKVKTFNLLPDSDELVG
jgi:hypothetical protein